MLFRSGCIAALGKREAEQNGYRLFVPQLDHGRGITDCVWGYGSHGSKLADRIRRDWILKVIGY